MPRRGNARVLHQRLGPGLAGFQLRSLGTGTEDGQAAGAHGIGHPRGQGGFRSDYHEVDALFPAERDQAVTVGFSDRDGSDALVFDLTAAVAGADPDPLDLRAAL